MVHVDGEPSLGRVVGVAVDARGELRIYLGDGGLEPQRHDPLQVGAVRRSRDPGAKAGMVLVPDQTRWTDAATPSSRRPALGEMNT
jgi:hypothetical protein